MKRAPEIFDLARLLAEMVVDDWIAENLNPEQQEARDDDNQKRASKLSEKDDTPKIDNSAQMSPLS